MKVYKFLDLFVGDDWHCLNMMHHFGIKKKDIDWDNPQGNIDRLWNKLRSIRPEWVVGNDFDDYYVKYVMHGRIPRAVMNEDIPKKYYKLIYRTKGGAGLNKKMMKK